MPLDPHPSGDEPPSAQRQRQVVAGNSAEPQAVHASGQHPTSSAPLGGGKTSAKLPPGAAREEVPSITADGARNASSTRAGTTLGKDLLCSACTCAKEVAGYSGKCRSHCCPGSMMCTTVVT